MRTLLDTDVISQLSKRPPNPAVAHWILEQDEGELFLSVITVYEIRYGVEIAASEKQRAELDAWINGELANRFYSRVLAVDDHVADATAIIMARSKKQGWNMKHMDAFIGATAMVYDMRLATLNRKHFARLPIELVNFSGAVQ